MHARVLAATMVVVLSLSVSPVFGQCWGSVATTYVPAEPAYTPYYAPTVPYYAPVPHVDYYAPLAAHTTYYPSPYATYYGPTVAAYPAYYARLGWSVFGAPRVYVAGQPVRNVLRAITP
jgi:hypothetical protein